MKKILVSASHFSELCPDAKAHLVGQGYKVAENTTDRPMSPDALIASVKDVYAVFVGLEVWDAVAFDAARQLKLLCRWGVGVDNIDLEEAKARGVTVTNAAGANRTSVAEHALALALGLMKHTAEYDRRTKGGQWHRVVSTELRGKTFGIVGMGTIGKTLADLLRGFGTRTLAYDIEIDQAYCSLHHVTPVSLETLLAEADVVSLHVPDTPQTHHIINKETLALMKSDAYLINTARGGLVDESALVGALSKGKLGGVALDVFETEPTDERNPLFRFDKVNATPHVAAFSRETFSNVAWTCIDALEKCVAGEQPDNRLV